MTTINEIIQLPPLKGLEIIGGIGGADRQISNVTIMEVPDCASWLKGGELIITALYVAQDDLATQCKLIEEFAKVPCSGVAIKSGQYIKTIPPQLIEIADRYNMPLLSIPMSMSYIDILLNVMMRFFAEQDSENTIGKHLKDIFFENYDNINYMKNRGNLLGINPDSNCFVLTIGPANQTNEISSSEMNSLKNLARSLVSFTENYKHMATAHAVDMERCVSVVFFSHDQEVLSRFMKIISDEALNQLNYYLGKTDFSIGIGRIEQGLDGIKKSFLYSSEAIVCGATFKPINRLHFYDKIEMYSLLSGVLKDNADSFISHVFRNIDNSQFIETLIKYFECDCNMTATASAMFVHTNTVKYRLHRLEELTGLRTSKPEDLLKLFLASLAYVSQTRYRNQ